MSNKKKKKPSKKTGRALITPETRKSKWVPFLIIAITAFIVYANSLGADFQWDDELVILNTSTVQNINDFSLSTEWKQINNRPLSMLSFAVNYYIHGFSPPGFHLVNLFIHILTGCLIFLLAVHIMRLPQLKSTLFQQYDTLIALFSALIFIAHPIQTGAVTYIVQRMTLMAGMFYLLALYLYAQGRSRHIEDGNGKTPLLYYGAAIVTGICAVLSKQNAATFPAAFLLYEIFFVRDREGRPYTRYGVTLGSALILTFLVIAATGMLPRETDTISRGNYLMTQFRVIVKYIQLILLPINQNVDYDFSISQSFREFPVVGSLVLLLGTATLGVLLFRKQRVLSFCIFWFFLTLSIESTLIPIRDVIFEHRLYLPLFGFSFGAVIALNKLIAHRGKKHIIALFSILIMIYGIAAIKRNTVWKTPYSLWSDAAKKSPRKGRPYSFLGRELMKMGEVDRAIFNFNKVLKYDPKHLFVIDTIGLAYLQKGDTERAIEYFSKAISIQPDFVKSLTNLGFAYYQKGDYERSLEYSRRAVKAKPDHFIALDNLGTLYYRQGDIQSALTYYKTALKYRPDYIKSLLNLGDLYVRLGKFDHATALYKRALNTDPENRKAREQLQRIGQKQKEQQNREQ